MSNFLISLWESVFTPGPTPTLLVATNASFAALQLVLFLLLLATYSLHFVVLSGLSAGLWWSINWFVRELQVSKAQEEKQKLGKETGVPDKRSDENARNNDDDGHLGSLDDSSETETEDATPAPEQRSIPRPESTMATSRLRTEDDSDLLRKRRSLGGTSESEGYMSTDSEWEKVDQQ